jgi:hypothetical protein
MNWSVVCAVNNEGLLRRCLLASPEISSAEVRLQKGYKSAALAYNSGIDQAQHDLIILAHQDMYLPAGWAAEVERAIQALATTDPNWGVLGCWGMTRTGNSAGYLYCTGNERMLGQRFETPVEVRSLDEAILIVRKSSELRFDEALQGYHLYGTDVCLEAGRQRKKSYVISACCIHNTNGYKLLPWDFWRAYLFMRRKWKQQLPVHTPCTTITSWCWPAIWWNMERVVNLALGRHRAGCRVTDPSRLCREIVDFRTVTPLV